MNREEFVKTKERLLREGKLYEDKDFPPSRKSLFYSNMNRDLEIVWKRPFDLVKKPRMFVDGPQRWDIIQGAIGNCWFVSALASICGYPKLVERIVPDSQTFYKDYCDYLATALSLLLAYVHIFKGSARFWQFGQWVTIVIDDRLPVNKNTNELIFIQSFRKEEFWSSMIEKAYAKFYGCYENLHGGRPSSGLLDLTGGISEWYQIKALPPNFHNRLLKYRNSNCILSCGIMGSANAVAEEKIYGNLLSKHAYSITDVKAVEYLSLRKDVIRHELVRIKNPWGSVEWQGAWSKNSKQWKSIPEKKRLSLGLKTDEDGEFWMCYQDFLLNFTDIYVCSVEPQMLGTKTDPGVRWSSVSYLGEWNFDILKTSNILHYSTIKFSQFQQFKVELTDVDLYDSDNRCELVVALLQRSQRYHRQQGIPMLPIGYYIFLLEKETEKLPLTDKFFKHNRPIATSRMSDSQEVTCRYKFQPGCYVIIPVTSPNKRGEFLLRLCFEKRGNIWGHVILYNTSKSTHTALEDYGWYMSTTPKVYKMPAKRGSMSSVTPYAIETAYEASEPMPGHIPPRHREISKHLSLEDSSKKIPKASPPRLIGRWSVRKSDNSCIEYQKKMSMAAMEPSEYAPGRWDEKNCWFVSTPASNRGSSGVY